MAPCAAVLVAAPFAWRPLWQMAGSLAVSQPPGATAAPASRLGFTATHEGNDWRLGWSREALSALDAVGAMLTIRDGGIDRLQFLSPRDLAAGAILYVPKTSDLLFNLRVTLPGGPEIEEQVRVLGQDQAAVPDLTYIPPPRRIGEASRTAPAPAAESAPAPAPAPAVAAATQPPPVQAAPQRRQFQPPPVPAVKAAAPTDVALPEVSLPTAAAPQLPRFIGRAPLPPLSSTPAPQQSPPQPAPQVLHPVTRVDASPLRSVMGLWPRNAARQGRIDVQIRVKIDAQGRVVGVTPIDRTVANFPFVDSAMTAARVWTFSPATENGKPIPSESVLTFKFTP